MKRLLIAALLMLGIVPASSADEPTTLRPLTGFVIRSISTGTSSTSVRALGAQTKWVRAVCTSDCHFAMTVTPIVASSTVPVFMPALVPEYFLARPGEYISVIMDSSTGNLHVTEMTR